MNHPKLNALLLALLVLVGLAAVVGGVGLVMRPDGTLLWMRTELLDHTGFRTFRVPGLLLIGLGVIELGAAVLLRHRRPVGLIAAQVAGAAVVVWIAVQSAIVWTLHPLQVLAFLTGAVIFTIAHELQPDTHGSTPSPA